MAHNIQLHPPNIPLNSIHYTYHKYSTRLTTYIQQILVTNEKNITNSNSTGAVRVANPFKWKAALKYFNKITKEVTEIKYCP
jgi:hypothetical protein